MRAGGRCGGMTERPDVGNDDSNDLPPLATDAEISDLYRIEVQEWRDWRATGQAPAAEVLLRTEDGHEVDALTCRAAVLTWCDNLRERPVTDYINPDDLPDDGDGYETGGTA